MFMRNTNTLEALKNNPEAFTEAFTVIDSAAQQVLPGSLWHPRYCEAEEVGLAAIIGPTGQAPDFYNPLIESVLERVPYHANNAETHPKAWQALESDAVILGGRVPEGLGRFNAFAAAKANHVNSGKDNKSSFSETIAIAPGLVGLAGAKKIGDAIISVSGLWEIHDLAIAWKFIEMLGFGRLMDVVNIPSLDRAATEMEEIFKKIENKLNGQNPAEISREDLKKVVDRLNGIMVKSFLPKLK